MAGAKRKAEMIKEGSSKGSKKLKTNSVQSLKPHSEQKETIKQEKTDVAAKHFTASAPGVHIAKRSGIQKAYNNTEREAKPNGTYTTNAKSSAVQDMKTQVQAESSNDESNSSDEDGGVALEEKEDMEDEPEKRLPASQQSENPDTMKATSSGAGINGIILH